MGETVRFGISIDDRLLERFDRLIEEKGYVNRSEAIRDLIRNMLVEERWEHTDEELVGTVTMVFDHHARELSRKLNQQQHHHHQEVVSSMHVHLDHDNCLEVVVVKGKAANVRRLASEMIGTKGVKHGKLVTTTTGEDLE